MHKPDTDGFSDQLYYTELMWERIIAKNWDVLKVEIINTRTNEQN